MKKLLIFIFFCLSLTGCKQDANKIDSVMSYDEMLISSKFSQTLGTEILTFDLNLEDIKNEKQEIVLLEKKGCKIIVQASYIEDRKYSLYFDFVEYVTENSYQTYSFRSYFMQNKESGNPNSMSIIYKSENKEVQTKLRYSSIDVENEPNATYIIHLTDDIIHQLGNEENIKVHIEMADYYFQKGAR